MEASHGPRFVSGWGLFLLLVIVCETFVAFSQSHAYPFLFVIGAVTSAPFIGGLVLGGHTLARTSISPDRYPRVVRWCVAAGGIFLLINLGLIAALPPGGPLETVGWIRWALSLGTGIGFLIGFYEATAIHREVVAHRSAVRAEELEHRRELLDYLNSLLRHEVLNAANVIGGYAELVGDTYDRGTPARRYADIIGRQANDLTKVTKDVRLFLRTIDGEDESERTNLSEALSDEVANIRDRHENVETEATIPDEVYVQADGLLRRIFSNLLDNAVEHNGSRPPRVAVSVETTDESVVVRIADNGPGVPESERERLFEAATDRSDHGMGLTIIDRLAERYDGRVELAETGPDGSVFVVELPRAE